MCSLSLFLLRFAHLIKRVAMRGWRDADSHSPILSRVMPGDLFLQKNVFFSPDLLESVLGDKFHREKKLIIVN